MNRFCIPHSHSIAKQSGYRQATRWRSPLAKAMDPEPDYQWLLDIADKADPKVRQAFLDAIDKAKAGVDDKALADAIATGDVNQVIRVLGIDQTMAPSLSVALGAPLEAAFIEAGRQTVARSIPTAGRLSMRFDIANPKATEFLRSYDLGLIREISNDTRLGIRRIVADAMAYGGHPYEQARQIRSLIGLTDRQAAAVSNFRNLLETGDREAMTRALRDRRFDPTLDRTLGADAERELTQEEIDRQVERYGERMLTMRAETIARTETIRAANAAQNAAWSQAADKGLLDRNTLRRQWLVVPDDRLCIYCAEVPDMNPDGVPLGGYFETPLGPAMYPPLHPQCFLGDTLVTPRSPITGYSRRAFDGDVAVVRTAAGNEFSCTVNHPILTRRGWVGAGALNEGDDLIGGAFGDGFGFGDAHDEDVPATIHEVTNALGRSREMSSAPVPVAAEDFHGDGEGSEVAVVGSNRLLWNERNASLSEQLRQFALSVPDVARSTLFATQREIDLGLERLGRAARRVMGCPHLSLAFGGGHARPLQRLSGASTPRFAAQLLEHTGDRNAADAKLARQLIDGRAGQIAANKVISVRRKPFSGHVYNLETEGGWYVANGIIAHNCRCVTIISAF